MKLDNPKLTAFALDELDPIERAEIEALLVQHPEAIEEINKTIEVSSLLHSVLQCEKAEEFTVEQRESILNNTASLTDYDDTESEPFTVTSSQIWEKQFYMQAVAASLMVACGLYFLYSGLVKKEESDLVDVENSSQATQPHLIAADGRSSEIIVRLLDDEIITETVAAQDAPRYEVLSEEPTGSVAMTNDLMTVIDETKKRSLVPRIGIDSTSPFIAPAPAPLVPQPLQIAKQTPKSETKHKSLRVLPAAVARELITAISTRDKTAKSGGEKLDTLASPVKIASPQADIPLPGTSAGYQSRPALIQNGLLPRDSNQFIRVADAPLSLTGINFDHQRFADIKSRLSRENENLPSLTELINAFQHTQLHPDAGEPFGVTLEIASCPWQPQHRLVMAVVQTAGAPSEALKTASKIGLQLDFNPLEVVAYRLLGQDSSPTIVAVTEEKPRPNTTVIALYEVIPAEQPVPGEGFQQSKYLPWNTLARKVAGRLPSKVQQELLTATLHYENGVSVSKHKIEKTLVDEGESWTDASTSLRWAASVTGYGMLLHQFSGAENLDIGVIHKMAHESSEGKQDRMEFLMIIQRLLDK